MKQNQKAIINSKRWTNRSLSHKTSCWGRTRINADDNAYHSPLTRQPDRNTLPAFPVSARRADEKTGELTWQHFIVVKGGSTCVQGGGGGL